MMHGKGYYQGCDKILYSHIIYSSMNNIVQVFCYNQMNSEGVKGFSSFLSMVGTKI